LAEAKKKKIVWVTAVDSSVITTFLDQMIILKEHGYELTAISSQEFPETPELCRKLGIDFIEVPIHRGLSPVQDLVSIYRLYRVFRRRRFDLIHTQMPKGTLVGAIAGRLAGIPVINTARPFFREMPEGLARRVFVWIERLAGMFTDLIMVENPLDYEMYLELGIAGKDKLHVQGNGADLSRFNASQFTKADLDKLREELGIPSSSRVIGIVARYIIEKGYLELFSAFKELREKYPDLFILAAAAHMPSEKGLVPKDLPEKMGIADRMILVENRSDMERLYPLMDVVVLPTHRDSFPRSLVEAAAMARPIVATDIVGCRIIIEDGTNGILIPPKDAKALAAAIARLLDDPAYGRKLAENARKTAIARFDAQKICRNISDCYRKLLPN
jgi:glycosyltransferase involved in cell wall biosynthesis